MRLNLVTSFGGYADIYESRQWSFGRGVCSGGSRGGKFLGSRVVKYNEKSTRGAILPAFFCGKKFYFAFRRLCIPYPCGIIGDGVFLIEIYPDIRIVCDIFRQSKFALFESVYNVAIPD